MGDLVNVWCELMEERVKSIRVSSDDWDEDKFIPKSVCDWEGRAIPSLAITTLPVEDWWVKKENLT